MGKNIPFCRENLKKIFEVGVPEGKKQLEYSDSKTSGLTLVQYPSGNQVYYFSLTYRKRRHRIRLGDTMTLKITEVRSISIEMRSAIQRGENPDETRKKAEMIFADLVSLYLDETKDKKITAACDESKTRLYLLPKLGNKQLSAISTTTIEKYHAQIKEKLSAATANRHLALLKAIFTFSVKTLKVLKESPAKGIASFPERQVKRKYFTFDELKLLLTALETESNTEARKVLKFLILTGCRRGTARCIKLENYDDHNGTILVEMTKTGVGQYLVLSNEAKSIIKEQVKKYGQHGLVFRGIDMVSPISCPSPILKRVCRSVGLPEVGVHALRHSYSVQLLENGSSQFQLQQALNHKCSASTAVYSNISNKKLSEINNNLAKKLSL
ncbi:MAG: integrase [Cocleimonas sp.]|jgi:integrase